MGDTIRYSGNNKEFMVPRKRYRLKKQAKIFLFAFFAILLTVFSIILFNTSTENESDYDVISYHEKGNLYYKVYYNAAEGFQEGYQPTSMTYVSNLIDHINLDFNYSLYAFEKFDITYSYEIFTELNIYNASNEDGVIQANRETLLKSEVFDITEQGFDIKEVIDINYNTYNDAVNVLKNKHGLQITADLVVSMNIISDSKYETVSKPLEINNDLSITIPLSEQLLDFELESETIDNSSYITDYSGERDNVLYYLGVACAIFAVLNVMALIIYSYRIFYNKDIYESTIKKYLREYDRLIVTSKQPNLNEGSFENKIRVTTIEELIDAHDSTNSPIIYYEVVPGEKSYFIIIDNNTLYKLTISRTFLEEEYKNKRGLLN